MAGFNVVILFLLASAFLTQVRSRECHQKVPASSFVAFPNLYNGVTVINPSVTGCDVFRSTQFRCDYSIVIGDSVQVPNETNLADNNYLKHFIAWRNTSVNSYVDFAFGDSTGVSAIMVSFLNSPQNRISLPYIHLYHVLEYGSTPENDQLFVIPSVLLDNRDLDTSDNGVRTVTLQLLSPLSSNIDLRIAFTFNSFHDFDTLLVNEVTFCADTQPTSTQNITFTDDQLINVHPSAIELSAGYLELVCTIASDGQYNWQWLKDSTVISSTGAYRITIRDGSRTSILGISGVNFNDAGQYQCNALTMLTDGVLFNSSSIVKTIQFPEYVITEPEVVGATNITLNCELHGYQSSLSPPMWFFSNNTPITTSSKYSLRSGQGMNTVTLENGTVLPSVTVSLTIRNLSEDDGGDYSCRGTRGGSSLTTLTVMMGTEPSSTQPPTTVTTLGMRSTTSNTGGMITTTTGNTESTDDPTIRTITNSPTTMVFSTSHDQNPTMLTEPSTNVTMHQLDLPVTGIVIGSVAGCLILIVGILILIVFCVKRRKVTKRNMEANNPNVKDSASEYRLDTPTAKIDGAYSFEIPENFRVVEKIPVMNKELFKLKAMHRTDSNVSTTGFEQSVVFSYFTDL